MTEWFSFLFRWPFQVQPGVHDVRAARHRHPDAVEHVHHGQRREWRRGAGPSGNPAVLKSDDGRCCFVSFFFLVVVAGAVLCRLQVGRRLHGPGLAVVRQRLHELPRIRRPSAQLLLQLAQHLRPTRVSRTRPGIRLQWLISVCVSIVSTTAEGR